jgi:hypothetical protein
MIACPLVEKPTYRTGVTIPTGTLDVTLVPQCACGASVAYDLRALHRGMTQVNLKEQCSQCISTARDLKSFLAADALARAEENSRMHRERELREKVAHLPSLEDGDWITDREYRGRKVGYLYFTEEAEARLPLCECGRPVWYELKEMERGGKFSGVMLSLSEQCPSCEVEICSQESLSA